MRTSFLPILVFAILTPVTLFSQIQITRDFFTEETGVMAYMDETAREIIFQWDPARKSVEYFEMISSDGRFMQRIKLVGDGQAVFPNYIFPMGSFILRSSNGKQIRISEGQASVIWRPALKKAEPQTKILTRKKVEEEN